MTRRTPLLFNKKGSRIGVEMEDVIAAIATPLGRGAIGVVRMSGRGAQEILKRVWKSRGYPVDKFVTHRLYLGNIVDLSTGELIDEVLATLMNAPHSYTGEDVVEISCHGGTVVPVRILNQLIKAGARPAEPGEFTRRAFLNGKMDLAKAEAVAALIDSRSELASKIAIEQIEGRLSRIINGWRGRLKGILARVEAVIDFPEEDIESLENSDFLCEVESIIREMKKTVKTYAAGRAIREGVKVVIAGPPNAGKSLLFNTLLGVDRAIVHHAPGTTRDMIEEEIILDGISFRLVDTAGIREAKAEVEEIGVRRSWEALKSAEMVILVVDGHDYTPVEEGLLDELRGVRHVIVAVNKKDLGITTPFPVRVDWRLFEVSAKTGEGVEDLTRGMREEILGGDMAEPDGIIITSGRHLKLIKGAVEGLSNAKAAILGSEPPEFTAHHIRTAADKIGAIVGEVTTEDVLNEIFERFCVGK